VGLKAKGRKDCGYEACSQALADTPANPVIEKTVSKRFQAHFLTQQKSGGLILIYVNTSINSRLSQQSNG
jgi:hypothetical protein